MLLFSSMFNLLVSLCEIDCDIFSTTWGSNCRSLLHWTPTCFSGFLCQSGPSQSDFRHMIIVAKRKKYKFRWLWTIRLYYCNSFTIWYVNRCMNLIMTDVTLLCNVSCTQSLFRRIPAVNVNRDITDLSCSDEWGCTQSPLWPHTEKTFLSFITCLLPQMCIKKLSLCMTLCFYNRGHNWHTKQSFSLERITHLNVFHSRSFIKTTSWQNLHECTVRTDWPKNLICFIFYLTLKIKNLFFTSVLAKIGISIICKITDNSSHICKLNKNHITTIHKKDME